MDEAKKEFPDEGQSVAAAPVDVPVDGGGLPAYDAAQPGRRGQRGGEGSNVRCGIAPGAPGAVRV